MTLRLRVLRGTTLLEVLVTVAILGVIAGVTVLAVRRMDPPSADDPRQILAESLRTVVATGRSAEVRIVVNGVMATAVVRPDGSIVADSSLEIERFTGRPLNAR